MSKPEQYLEFKIETAENMSKDKIIFLAHPEHGRMLSILLYKLQQELKKYGKDS